MANVKGPVPPGPRVPTHPTRTSPRQGPARSKASGGRAPRRGAPTARESGQLISDEDLEIAAGFVRAHAAELEEEGRRHACGDAELERAREAEEELAERRIKGLAFDEDQGRRRGRQRDDEDTEDAEDANDAAKGAQRRGWVGPEGAGRYFQDLPADRLGDLTLTDPREMRRLLGPSVRFAQHAMLLAQAELQAGVTREDALAFLADIYVQSGDRTYANKALREFGPATGILDLYPLELLDHLLEFVPGFCHRVSRGRVLASSPPGGYRTKAGRIITLEHDPALRIRGFAIKGGARPGYLLEPTEPPGRYHLVFLSPGCFTVMISAISRDGSLYLETVECEVAPGDDDELDALTGLEREREHDRRARDAADGDDGPSPDGKTAKRDDLTIHFPRRI